MSREDGAIRQSDSRRCSFFFVPPTVAARRPELRRAVFFVFSALRTSSCAALLPNFAASTGKCRWPSGCNPSGAQETPKCVRCDSQTSRSARALAGRDEYECGQSAQIGVAERETYLYPNTTCRSRRGVFQTIAGGRGRRPGCAHNAAFRVRSAGLLFGTCSKDPKGGPNNETVAITLVGVSTPMDHESIQPIDLVHVLMNAALRVVEIARGALVSFAAPFISPPHSRRRTRRLCFSH